MAGDTSSPYEAAIAASRVQKLMAEYDLEMVDVIAQELEDEENIVQGGTGFRYKRTPNYIEWIETAIARAFNCQVRGKKTKRGNISYEVTTYYGYKTDVEVATWLCIYVCDQLERLAKRVQVPEQYRWRGFGRRYMADWRKGAAEEISNRIRTFYGRGEQNHNEPTTSTGHALVSLKTAAIERKFGRVRYSTSHTQRYTRDGMFDGRLAAESINISRNIKSGDFALEHLQ